MELVLLSTVLIGCLVRLLQAAGIFRPDDEPAPTADDFEHLHNEVLPAEAAKVARYRAALAAQNAEQAAEREAPALES